MRASLLHLSVLALACLSAAPSSVSLASTPGQPSREGVEFFEKHVRPLFAEKCLSCHGPKVQRGGLRMDSRAALLTGGDSGPALVTGKPDTSLLLRAVRRQGDLKMPPKDADKLSPASIALLAAWVQMGAPWPAGDGPAPALGSVALARKTHWSFRPVVRSDPPRNANPGWARTPIDRFILVKLEARKLAPSAEADRRTLVRRLAFDLIGLPPTPEEVEAFVRDTRPDAYERVVDRLLASPAHGERWGRHWLDVARYADTKGYVFQEERRYPYAFTYRDYVVTALNGDLPYDRFLLEQLAADRLALGEDRKPLAAMGFLTLGRRFLNNVHDIIDDRIDVVSRGLMGLTVSCARCHDHKFDPIPTRDYYSLHGVFASSMEPAELPMLEKHDPTAPPSAFEVELRKRQAALDEFIRTQQAEQAAKARARTADYLLGVRDAIRKPDEKPLAPTDLQPVVLARWRARVTSATRAHDPVLAPWLVLARLPQTEFTARAPALVARISANKEPGRPINPLVAKAFAGAVPATLTDVARKYADLFAQAEKRAPEKASDPAWKAIHQVLHGPDSPVLVPVGELPRLLDRARRNRFTMLRRQVDQWRASSPGGPLRAMVLVDAPNPTNPQVFVRGNPGNRGVAVPRQFLEVLAADRRAFTQGSGRLELARSIASADNPLTARVMVNRVWMHHFGQGLVRTPGDFGTRGEAPSHPELLDWLAAEFVESGWSLKKLHRLIVTSAVYRQVSDDDAKGLATDPENVFLWRTNRRRLELEPLRDAMLAVSDRLDRRMGGPAVDITKSPYPPRRSVYAFIERQNLPGLFRTFDLASPDVSTPQRHSTTVPQQSLFLMNSPFVQDLARSLAARVERLGLASDRDRVTWMHQLCLGRPADTDEIELARVFLSERRSAGLTPWEQYAQVLLLSNEFAFVD